MKTNLPSLSHLYLYLTEGCNLACKHCWINPPLDSEENHHAFLAVELIQKAINEAKPLGLNSLKLTGGEPLMHPQIVDIINLASAENLKLTIETNGTLITDSFIVAIKNHKNAFVSVSLDSSKQEVHDAFRGIPGSFSKTVSGIKKLVDAGISPQIICSLIPENLDDIEDVVRFSKKIGASSFKLNIIQPTNRGDLMYQRGESVSLPDILTVYKNVTEKLVPELEMSLYPDLPIAFKPLGILNRDGGGRCAVKHIIGVLATGQYALCGIGTSVEELIFGGVGVDSLKEIWENNPVIKEIRNELPKNLTGICGRCMLKDACMGACIAQNYYRNKSLKAPYWFCEMAEEQGLFPESRLLP